MAKQIKIGFDKSPIPVGVAFQPLYDINTGIPLKNSNGDPLFTEEIAPLERFGRSSRALSTYVNNDEDNAAPIFEVFPETSQVSSTLLGVPRAETQLGLFSDVSTYGLDDDIWEFFRNPVPSQPAEWISRANPTYGPRFYQRLEEIPNEQAIALTAFPTPWTFPFGPGFADVGRFNSVLFERYKQFITLGNIFYDEYSSRGFTDFANENFLSSSFVTIDLSTPNEVLYNETLYTIPEIFAQIERWTLAWMKLRDGQLFDPLETRIRFPILFDSNNTNPGYNSQVLYFCQLESKRVFRYQPGRISGFTFGVRASTDPGSSQNVIEWGCANETDAYVYQIRGSQFNIVRRSTIPLPEANLRRMGLTQEDQRLVSGLWETVISRDLFNGDSLDGNGPSGYVISFEEVTMYKIEFSWYGAIGAKFYAYIPVRNDDARWVLIHTIVIENELGKPCLNDPFFKFRYTLSLSDTSNLTYPQYIYKYGASYYIDGGDEGTVTNHSYSSNIVPINPSNSRSLVGIKSKDEIFNKDGIASKNRKDIIPKKLTISSTTDARIDIIECEGCPGHSYHYAPSLVNGVSGIVGSLTISANGATATFVPSNPANINFVPENPNLFSKIIFPGIYDAYLYQLPDDTLGIARRAATSVTNNDINKQKTFLTTNQIRLPNGSRVPLKGETFENVRLTQFSDIIASTTPLVKKNIQVNFLNPRASDGPHFAEFFIGITDKEPALDTVTGDLLFDNQPLDLGKLLFTEYAQYSASKDINGFDTGESDIRLGNVFEMDYRLKTPPGVDSGRCSTVLVEVGEFEFDVTYSSSNPVTGASGDFIIFRSEAITNFDDLEGGEIAARSEITSLLVGTGITFLDNQATRYRDSVTLEFRHYIRVSGEVPTPSKIYIRVLTMSGARVRRSKSFSWNVFPLYVVVGMRDRARINNVTIEEYDDISKFNHTPTWIKGNDSNITVVNSGSATEGFNSNGLFRSGGLSNQGDPPSNFIGKNRLDSAEVDTQLQQPLRPGQIKTSVFVGANESAEIDLDHVFGQDRNVITPGLLNTKATFMIAKAISTSGEIQVNVNTKEQ